MKAQNPQRPQEPTRLTCKACKEDISSGLKRLNGSLGNNILGRLSLPLFIICNISLKCPQNVYVKF